MKISARPSATAALSAATEASPNTSQSSHTLVSRTRIKIATAASSQNHQFRRGALLHEHDGVLAEQAPERFGVLAIDADDQAAGLSPASIGLAALARAPRIARGRDQLVERAQRRGVFRCGLLLAARVGRGDERGGGGAFLL